MAIRAPIISTLATSPRRRLGYGSPQPLQFCRNGRYCGRRAAILYGAGELFACRRCYGLSYASPTADGAASQLGGGPKDQDEAGRNARRPGRAIAIRLAQGTS